MSRIASVSTSPLSFWSQFLKRAKQAMAGIASQRPISVVINACEMPIASSFGFGAVEDFAMIMKLATIPSTVPSRPRRGSRR